MNWLNRRQGSGLRVMRGIALGALFCILLSAFTMAAPPRWETLVIETGRAEFAFTVETVDTPALRRQGLQDRQHLEADRGMLFDFKKSAPVAMWMKDTLISLDMIFIDCAGRVLNVVMDTTPHSQTPIPSAGPALAVLELAAGTSRRLGIDTESRIRHRIFDADATVCRVP